MAQIIKGVKVLNYIDEILLNKAHREEYEAAESAAESATTASTASTEATTAAATSVAAASTAAAIAAGMGSRAYTTGDGTTCTIGFGGAAYGWTGTAAELFGCGEDDAVTLTTLRVQRVSEGQLGNYGSAVQEMQSEAFRAMLWRWDEDESTWEILAYSTNEITPTDYDYEAWTDCWTFERFTVSGSDQILIAFACLENLSESTTDLASYFSSSGGGANSVAGNAIAMKAVENSSDTAGLITYAFSRTTLLSSLTASAFHTSLLPAYEVTYALAADANLPLNVLSYGATGDGETDDTTAWTTAIAAALSTGKALYAPAGTYVLSSVPAEGFTCWTYDSSRTPRRQSLHLYGDGTATRLVFKPTEEWACLFRHADYASFHDFTVLDATYAEDQNAEPDLSDPSTLYNGVVFATPIRTQSHKGTFARITSYGNWHYFYYSRFTMNDRFEDIKSTGACVHFCFASGDGGVTADADDWTWDDQITAFENPRTEATDSWNGGSAGWFHNCIAMTNISMKYGECGIYGATMGLTADTIDAEQMVNPSTSYATNLSVFLGSYNQPATAVWIAGTSTKQTHGNLLGTLYTEGVERPITIDHCGYLGVGTVFAQGAWDGQDEGSAGALFYAHATGTSFGLCELFDAYHSVLKVGNVRADAGTWSRIGRSRAGSTVHVEDTSGISATFAIDEAVSFAGTTTNGYAKYVCDSITGVATVTTQED